MAKEVDLTNPKDCREFLESIKVDGKQVKSFWLAAGVEITIDEMNDEMLIQYANQLHQEMFGGKEQVDTEIYTGAH